MIELANCPDNFKEMSQINIFVRKISFYQRKKKRVADRVKMIELAN